MSRNYYRKLSACIYHHAKNVVIIGILAYPKSSVHLQCTAKDEFVQNILSCFYAVLNRQKSLSIPTENNYFPEKSSYFRPGRRGIAPTRTCIHLSKHVLNLFVCIKLNLFLTIFIYIYNRDKTRPGRPQIQF